MGWTKDRKLIATADGIGRSLRRIADMLESAKKTEGMKKVQTDLTAYEENRLLEQAQAEGHTMSELLRKRLQKVLKAGR